jgi:Domain of Unknown Function (DUF1080)
VATTLSLIAGRTPVVGTVGACVAMSFIMVAHHDVSTSTTRGGLACAAAGAPSGWRSLFDGRTTAGWRGYRAATMPAGWSVSDGTLHKEGPTADIVTTDQFGNFELDIDWKIGPGGNSGIFYRGTEAYDHIYWSAPEYQLLDDSLAPDGRSRLTAAGSDYALYPAPAGIVKPANEWNSTRIIVCGSHVEHWMNGQKLLEYDLGSADWVARVKQSKFVVWPQYGRATRGYIGIQGDHAGTLALRNIRVLALP